MSDTSQGPGWWLASDDKWYAPELHGDPEYRAQWAAPPIPPPIPETPAVTEPVVEERSEWAPPVDETPDTPVMAEAADAAVDAVAEPDSGATVMESPSANPLLDAITPTDDAPVAEWAAPEMPSDVADMPAPDIAAADLPPLPDAMPEVPPVPEPTFVADAPAAYAPTEAVPLVAPDPTTMQPPVVAAPAAYAPAQEIPAPSPTPDMLHSEQPPTAWPQYGTPEVATADATAKSSGPWGRLTGLIMLASGVVAAFASFLNWYEVDGLLDRARRVSTTLDGFDNNYAIPTIIAAVVLGGVGGAKLVGASNKILRLAGIVGGLVLVGVWVVAYIDMTQQRDDLATNPDYLSVHIWGGLGLWLVGLAGMAAAVAALLDRD